MSDPFEKLPKKSLNKFVVEFQDEISDGMLTEFLEQLPKQILTLGKKKAVKEYLKEPLENQWTYFWSKLLKVIGENSAEILGVII